MLKLFQEFINQTGFAVCSLGRLKNLSIFLVFKDKDYDFCAGDI